MGENVETFTDRNGTKVAVAADTDRDAVVFEAAGRLTGWSDVVFVIDVHTAKRLGEFLVGLED